MKELETAEPVSIQMRDTIKKIAWVSFWTPFPLGLIDAMSASTFRAWPSSVLIAVSLIFLPVMIKLNETLAEMDDGKTAVEMPQWINDCFDQDSQISLRLNLPFSGEVERDLNGLRGIRVLITIIWVFLAIHILCVLCYWVATCFSGCGKDERD